MELPYFYVREKSSTAAHHWDYLRDRADSALCGHGYVDPITLGEVPRPKSVCRACQARLPEWEAKWWRQQAEGSSEKLADLQKKYDGLAVHADNQQRQLRNLQEAKRQKKVQAPQKPTRLSPRVSQPGKKKRSRQPPPIRVVSGGLPGLGYRR